MILYPAIDIRRGKCVRLLQGDYTKENVYGDPVEMAKKWEKLGAQYLHVVDLDGALAGESINMPVISRIVKEVTIPVQVGGGVRTIETIKSLLNIGAKRIILSSAAIKNELFFAEVIKFFGEAIALSIDAKNGFVATDGWTNISDQKALDVAKKWEEKGLKTVVYTDISKDGMLNGPNVAELERMNGETNLQVIASGGVATIEDMRELAKRNLYGVIIGKALYTGKIDLKQALKEVAEC